MSVVLNRSTTGLHRIILGRTEMTESDPRVSALFARDTRIAATDTFASAVR